MVLILLILLPLGAALLAPVAGRLHPRAPHRLALAATALTLGLTLAIALAPAAGGSWPAELRLPWIPRFGIGFHLGLDGLSLALLLLTALLGVMAVVSAWWVSERAGFHFFNLLLTLAGLTGLFLALDLFLFFFFWEAMLIPMYLLIALWGHEGRYRAAIKFVLFTQASGLLLLAAIIGLALGAREVTGRLSFDYTDLLAGGHGGGPWLLLGFFLAFTVKLPMVPLHTWLPDAHTQAPTAGSVLLAGVMLKAGAYGLMRFALPLFPSEAQALAPYAIALGVAGILYGALLAAGQRDLKRLVAYTSVSHMGFVLLGLFVFNPIAWQGVVVQLVAHGLGTGALFMLVGSIEARLHTRDLDQMGGLWAVLPRLSALLMFFAIAALGLPGLGNFVGEFLVLLGAWREQPLAAALAALGLVLAAVYALILVQRSLHGAPRAYPPLADYGARELTALGTLGLLLAWIGLFPGALLALTAPAVAQLLGADGLALAGGLP